MEGELREIDNLARSLSMAGFRYFAFPPPEMPQPAAAVAEPVAILAAPDEDRRETAATIATVPGVPEPRRAARSAPLPGGAGSPRAYALLADVAARPGSKPPATPRAPARAIRLRVAADQDPPRR